MFELQRATPSDVWVQCDSCDQWRALPPLTDPASLPRLWYCSMLPKHNGKVFLCVKPFAGAVLCEIGNR